MTALDFSEPQRIFSQEPNSKLISSTGLLKLYTELCGRQPTQMELEVLLLEIAQNEVFDLDAFRQFVMSGAARSFTPEDIAAAFKVFRQQTDPAACDVDELLAAFKEYAPDIDGKEIHELLSTMQASADGSVTYLKHIGAHAAYEPSLQSAIPGSVPANSHQAAIVPKLLKLRKEGVLAQTKLKAAQSPTAKSRRGKAAPARTTLQLQA